MSSAEFSLSTSSKDNMTKPIKIPVPYDIVTNE